MPTDDDKFETVCDLLEDEKMNSMILKSALKVMTESLDDLIGACIDENGKFKQPEMRDLMKARGMLPKWCKYAFPEKKVKNAN